MNSTATYENLRQLADSWGLVLTGLMFLALVLWPFRPGSAHQSDAAAKSIFEDESND